MQKWSLIVVAVMLSNMTVLMAHPHCSSGPASAGAAVTCAKKEIFSNLQEVFGFAESKNHLGNLKICKTRTHRRSYFTDSYEEFKQHIDVDGITCQISKQDPDAYSCQILGIPGCYSSPYAGKKGQLSKKACFRIGKTSGQFYSFFPIRPSAPCD